MKAKECPGTSKQMLEKLGQAHPAEPYDIESLGYRTSATALLIHVMQTVEVTCFR